MSTKFPGGFITKSPVAPTSTAASGIWTLDQQQQAQKAGTWPSPPIFIEDLFSTWLYTGNGSTQTITNGIDLANKGGLVWSKETSFTVGHVLYDTARGPYPTAAYLTSNLTDAASLSNAANFANITSFNSNGYSIGSTSSTNIINFSGSPFISWTFRKQPKFFDVVTWTGNGANRTIAHNLNSVPGCIIIKRTDTSSDWQVYHRSLANTQYMVLNTTAAVATGATRWNSTTPTDTVFSLGTDATVNASGGTYVAYLFAHDAGGFPASGSGSTNGISCGSYTGNGSATGPVVSLGYEPQWLMVKNATGTGNWSIIDNMRGMPVGSADVVLLANTNAGGSSVDYVSPTATGFQVVTTNAEVNTNASTYIYIAIRRGPMKVPTTGTSVFTPIARTGTSSPTTVTGVGFPPDLVIGSGRSNATGKTPFDRLRGATKYLDTTVTSAEGTDAASLTSFAVMDGYGVGADNGSVNTVNFAIPLVSWNFRRAPGFFDEVCFLGSGAGPAVTHGLGVAPELIIQKNRDGGAFGNWFAFNTTQYLILNLSNAATAYSSSITSTTFQPVTQTGGTNYVAYLFASCPGVSKVGSYTGTGTTQVINCGFTGGARFVLIKRTDSTGDWYVWDTARGMIPANDPYLLLNSTAAEVTGTDYVDTTNVGFEITSTAPAAINASGGTFIFLAIA